METGPSSDCDVTLRMGGALQMYELLAFLQNSLGHFHIRCPLFCHSICSLDLASRRSWIRDCHCKNETDNYAICLWRNWVALLPLTISRKIIYRIRGYFGSFSSGLFAFLFPVNFSWNWFISKSSYFFSNRFGTYWFFWGWLVGMLRLTKVLPLKNFPVVIQMNSMSQTAYLTTY